MSSSSGATPTGAQRLRVLLIEDEDSDARLVQEYAREGGMDVLFDRVRDLPAAMQVLRNGEVDLVLLDLGLPGSFGIETLYRFRADAPDVAVVVLTGLDDAQTGLEAVREGAQDYVVKDRLHPESLGRILVYAKERHRHLREQRRRLRWQGLLTTATRTALRAESVGDLTRSLAAQARIGLGVDRVYVAVPEEPGRLAVAAALGWDDAGLGEVVFETDDLGVGEQQVIGQALASGRWVGVTDLAAQPAGFLDPVSARQARGSGLWVPVEDEGGRLLVVACADPVGRVFLAHEGIFIEQLGMITLGAMARLAAQAEVRRREAEARRLATAVTAAANAVVITDGHGVIQWVNDAYTRQSGYSAAELAGARPNIVNSGVQPAAFYEDLWATITSGAPWRGRIVNRHKGGELYTVDTTITPVVDRDGTIAEFVAVQVDVTEMERVTRRLASDERRFRQLADNATDIVALVRVGRDLSLEIDYVNPAVERLLGYSPDEVLADPNLVFSRAFAPDDSKIELPQDHPDGVAHSVVAFRTVDGEQVWLDVLASIVDDTTSPPTTQLVARDVTADLREREAMREAMSRHVEAIQELQRVNELRESVLQNVSHEVRTPLTTLVGFLETLVVHGHELDPARVAGIHRRLLRNARRLQGLLDDVLAFRDVSAGQEVGVLARAPVGTVVGEAVLDHEVGRHRLHVDVADGVVQVDPSLVRSVVHRLLDNVARHTPDDATAWVRLTCDVDTAVLVVEDDGPGYPPGDRRALLEPFRQGASTLGLASPGTGLGLALVHAYAVLHGGGVELSDRPGGGARATVTLSGRGVHAPVVSATSEPESAQVGALR